MVHESVFRTLPALPDPIRLVRPLHVGGDASGLLGLFNRRVPRRQVAVFHAGARKLPFRVSRGALFRSLRVHEESMVDVSFLWIGLGYASGFSSV